MNKDRLLLYAGLKQATEIIDYWYKWIRWEIEDKYIQERQHE